MAAGQVIRIKEIGNVLILLIDRNNIKLKNIVLAPECNSNIILLGQLQETGITYYNNPTAMTLI